MRLGSRVKHQPLLSWVTKLGTIMGAHFDLWDLSSVYATDIWQLHYKRLIHEMQRGIRH